MPPFQVCMQVRNCTLGDEYESKAPTAFTDRECTNATKCTGSARMPSRALSQVTAPHEL